MTDKSQNIYRIPSNRWQNWDYSAPGSYFITMVTQNRDCILGKIENDEMILSDFGKMVNTEWHKSFEIRDELFLDEFVIMPNHLHAIIMISNKYKTNGMNDDNCTAVKTHGRSSVSDIVPTPIVETHGRASLQSPPIPPPPIPPVFERQPKSISSFIAGFKSAVNSKIDDYIDNNHLKIPKYNKNNHFWQPNYHDHIIRDEQEYERIWQYIIDNPAKWADDKFNNHDDIE